MRTARYENSISDSNIILRTPVNLAVQSQPSEYMLPVILFSCFTEPPCEASGAVTNQPLSAVLGTQLLYVAFP